MVARDIGLGNLIIVHRASIKNIFGSNIINQSSSTDLSSHRNLKFFFIKGM